MDGVPSNAPRPSSQDGARADTHGASLAGRLRALYGDLRRRFDDVLSVGETAASQSEGANLEDDPTAPVEMERFPDRAYPLTYPGRDIVEINTTDAVGIETEDGLRLSVPENPDATILSDEWVPIER